jgi:hypothetical protein
MEGKMRSFLLALACLLSMPFLAPSIANEAETDAGCLGSKIENVVVAERVVPDGSVVTHGGNDADIVGLYGESRAVAAKMGVPDETASEEPLGMTLAAKQQVCGGTTNCIAKVCSKGKSCKLAPTVAMPMCKCQ